MRKETFEEIYSKHTWGGVSKSGPGSDPLASREYVKFVNNFLEKNTNIKSIIEIGCGDWATSELLKISPNCSYLGYDIVESIIKQNTIRFGNEKRQFACADFMTDEIQSGDLLLIKDVLQHLSNDVVNVFIKKVLPKYKIAIITNDVIKFRQRTLLGLPYWKFGFQQANIDILDGKSRPLEIDKSPFMLKLSKKFRYKNIFSQGREQAVFLKEVCLCVNK